MKNIVEFKNVSKIYQETMIKVNALDQLSLEIKEGQLVVILGPSGAGKTTLLNLLGAMDTITSGELLIDGIDIGKYNQRQLTVYRRNDIGFVFQFYNLMPNLTALENIELAIEISKDAIDPKIVLNKVGLADRANNFCSQLSGGEQQRVAIARAIAKNPKILLCDEPTGALDYITGKQILKLLQDFSRSENKTVIIVSHNAAIKAMADYVIIMKNGQVVDQYQNLNPQPIEEIQW